jgi:hypothetical protein
MTPPDRRRRLFKRGKPWIRPFQLMDGNDYSKDLKTLWVAHSHDPFEEIDKDISQQEFINIISSSTGNDYYIADDFNVEYEDKGPVAIISVINNDWTIEPHVRYFPWATKRNVLGVTVSFLQMIKWSKRIGVCIVHAKQDYINLFDQCVKYGVLLKLGRMLRGRFDGDDYIYYIPGRRVK